MIASTVERVPQNTACCINEEIRLATEHNIAYYASKGPAAIDQRLDELEQEWDIERLLETNASIACLVGLTLGVTVNRKWLLLSAGVAGFLLQHAVQGWCPPLPIFRRLGVRTAAEIDYERYALKAIRGDFRQFTGPTEGNEATAHDAFNAARTSRRF